MMCDFRRNKFDATSRKGYTEQYNENGDIASIAYSCQLRIVTANPTQVFMGGKEEAKKGEVPLNLVRRFQERARPVRPPAPSLLSVGVARASAHSEPADLAPGGVFRVLLRADCIVSCETSLSVRATLSNLVRCYFAGVGKSSGVGRT